MHWDCLARTHIHQSFALLGYCAELWNFWWFRAWVCVSKHTKMFQQYDDVCIETESTSWQVCDGRLTSTIRIPFQYHKYLFIVITLISVIVIQLYCVICRSLWTKFTTWELRVSGIVNDVRLCQIKRNVHPKTNTKASLFYPLLGRRVHCCVPQRVSQDDWIDKHIRNVIARIFGIENLYSFGILEVQNR